MSTEERLKARAKAQKATARQFRREQIAMGAPIALLDANEPLHQNPDASRFVKPGEEAAFPMHMIVKEAARLSVMYADALIAELDGGDA